MADRELFHWRSEAYSAFHRTESVNRFLQNPDLARSLGMIDLDNVIWVEWERGTYRPLALVETALDTPKSRSKCVLVLKALALMAGLPAFLVLVTESEAPNPSDPKVPDVRRFAVRRIDRPGRGGFVEYTPQEYVNWLVQLRQHQTRQLVRTPPLPFEPDAAEGTSGE